MFFKKAVNEAELTDSLPEKAPLIARCSSGKVLGLLLGQLYVGPNSLWAPFVIVVVQLMYCLVLCSGFAGMHPTSFFFCPTKIEMLKSLLVSTSLQTTVFTRGKNVHAFHDVSTGYVESLEHEMLHFHTKAWSY